MAAETQFLLGLQLLIALLIVYDVNKNRDWMGRGKLFLVLFLVFFLPLVGAVIYLLAVIRGERELVECPECGEKIHRSEDECPHCASEPPHPEPDEYRCEECGEEFDTYRGALEHRVTHRGGEQGGEGGGADGETYSCADCGREFDSKRGLGVHRAQKHG